MAGVPSVAARLAEQLAAFRLKDVPDEVVAQVVAHVIDFSQDRLRDDVAVLALQLTPSSPRP